MNVYIVLAIVFQVLAAIFGFIGSEKSSKSSTDEIKKHIDKSVTPPNQSPPSGDMELNDGSEVAIGTDLKVKIQYSSNTTHFKISDEPNFINREWQPVKNFTTFKVSKFGRHAIYIQFAANGFAGSPISKSVDIYGPPNISEVFIFKFNFPKKEVGPGFANLYVVNNPAYGEDTYVMVMNIDYPGHELASDVPTFSERFHITHWRYAFDGSLASEKWTPVETIVWAGSALPLNRYHFPVVPPKVLGQHKLEVQVRSASGDSQIFKKTYEAKIRPE
ncbi:MAG: hypothetical protein EOP06_12510 [Proteobacteria bacterium]|nr:MAG: hypothetical protein EOP06_12510 [Pseudomonadota bacterium]